MLGGILRNIRSYNKVTLTQLSEEFNISQGYLSDIERGKKEATLEILNLYSTKFSIPLSAILFFQENIDEPEKIRKIRSFFGKKAAKLIDYLSEDGV